MHGKRHTVHPLQGLCGGSDAAYRYHYCSDLSGSVLGLWTRTSITAAAVLAVTNGVAALLPFEKPLKLSQPPLLTSAAKPKRRCTYFESTFDFVCILGPRPIRSL